MESSVGSILAALVIKANDPADLHRTIESFPETYRDLSWPALACWLAPGFPWVNTGSPLLARLFHSDDSALADAIASDTGVGTASACTLLAVAAVMVLQSLQRQMQERDWSTRDLGNALRREAATIRSALPASVSDLLWRHPSGSAAVSLTVSPSVRRARFPAGGWGALALAAVALGCFWLVTHGPGPIGNASVMNIGEADRMAGEPGRLGEFVKQKLPDGADLNVPSYGIESRLLGAINGSSHADQTSWLSLDGVFFESGSARLGPDSSGQLNNIAEILKAYPQVRLRLAGYADAAGTAQQNLALSLARARNVKAELVTRGISPQRLTTVGFGEAISADNSTAAGRALNRCVAVQVTQR